MDTRSYNDVAVDCSTLRRVCMRRLLALQTSYHLHATTRPFSCLLHKQICKNDHSSHFTRCVASATFSFVCSCSYFMLCRIFRHPPERLADAGLHRRRPCFGPSLSHCVSTTKSTGVTGKVRGRYNTAINLFVVLFQMTCNKIPLDGMQQAVVRMDGRGGGWSGGGSGGPANPPR